MAESVKHMGVRLSVCPSVCVRLSIPSPNGRHAAVKWDAQLAVYVPCRIEAGPADIAVL